MLLFEKNFYLECPFIPLKFQISERCINSCMEYSLSRTLRTEYSDVYINQYRSTNATVLSGLTSVARYRSNQLVTNFAHTDGIDACNALQYGEFVDMTLYGMSESDSYYQGYNREAIAKGNWTGSADEIAQRIANGFKNSSSHWSYLDSSEYSYIAVGCTYDEASSMWYCCICVSSKNYGG